MINNESITVIDIIYIFYKCIQIHVLQPFLSGFRVKPFGARREMQKLPYDESKEGVIRAPNYVGWDQEIDTDFKKLTVGAVKGGRWPLGSL